MMELKFGDNRKCGEKWLMGNGVQEIDKRVSGDR